MVWYVQRNCESHNTVIAGVISTRYSSVPPNQGLDEDGKFGGIPPGGDVSSNALAASKFWRREAICTVFC